MVEVHEIVVVEQLEMVYFQLVVMVDVLDIVVIFVVVDNEEKVLADKPDH